MDDEQKLANMLTQLEIDRIVHELTGTRYLLKPNGRIVLRYPNGEEGEIPKYEDYEDEVCW